jgi:hypothetical protein
VLWEIVLQIFTEVSIELGFGSIKQSLRERSGTHPVVAGVRLLWVGA